jgi:hypothetical protein
LPLAAMFGGPIGGWMIEKYGRKSTIFFNVRNNDKNYILSNVLKIYKNIKINLAPKSNKIFRNPEE